MRRKKSSVPIILADNTRPPGAPPSQPAAPGAISETIDFGALTLANAGGAAPQSVGVTITSASITAGSDGHWAISSSGVLTRNVAGVSAATLSCLLNGTITATITINPIASAYSVASSTEMSNLLTGVSEATLSGKRVLYRPGSYTFPSLSGGQLYSSTLTHESHDHDDQAIINRWVFAGSSTSPGNVTLKYLTFYAAWSIGATDPFIDMHSGCSSHDIVIDNCTIYTDLQPARLGGSIGTLSPDTRNFKYAIALNGTCSNITITNNTIHHMVHGIFLTGSNITVRGNTMHHCWGDFINISAQFNGTATSSVTIEYNDQNNMCPDASLCHPDFVQGFLQGGGTPGNVTDVTVRGNTHWEGFEGENQSASGGVSDIGDQFMLLQDLGGSAKYMRWTIEGNVASLTAQAGISFEERIETATIRYNTLGRNWPSVQDQAHGFGNFAYACIIISDGDANVSVMKNTAEYISVTGGGTVSNNVSSISRTNISTYQAAFAGSSFNPMSRAALLEQFAFKPNGVCDLNSSGGAWTTADAGALGTTSANGYYNFDTGALN